MNIRLRVHHQRQVPVDGLNQMFRLFRPFTGTGIGVVILHHEFSLTFNGPVTP